MNFRKTFSHNIGLVVFFAILVVILIFLVFGESIQFSYNSPDLRLILNAIFISATNIFVASISLRSFLRYGLVTFIFLSSALIVSGLAAFFSGWASGISTNATFAIFNLGFLLSSVMQAFGAVHLSSASITSMVYSHRELIVVMVLLLSSLSVVSITVLSLLGLMSQFIIPNDGTTDLRQFVVGLSFVFFVLASVIIGYQYVRTKARGLYWYSLALALFAIDTFISYNSVQLSDTLQWVGRIADYTGGLFFIFAVISLRQQALPGADYSERWFETFSNNRIQLATLFSNMLSGFAYLRVITDEYGNAVDAVILEVNEAFETDTGLRRQDVIGKNITEVIVGIEQDPSGWVTILDRTARKGIPVKVESYIQRLDRWFRISAYCPEPGFLALILENSTKQKQLQKQLEEYTKNLEKIVEERTNQLKMSERMAAIGQTAGMVGHDIRNPLQAITGDLYLIEQEIASNPNCVNAATLESIAAINENISYINKIVSDLQDYTRTIKPIMTLVNLKDVVTSSLAGRNIPKDIDVKISAATDLKLKTDETLLRRIITNLLTNSIQAMPNGGKLIIDSSKDDNTVFICIQDTGVGIPETVKPNLFKPLYTTKSKGQGLGLAVVKRLVDVLNGDISYESQEGKGTKFTIQLPLGGKS